MPDARTPPDPDQPKRSRPESRLRARPRDQMTVDLAASTTEPSGVRLRAGNLGRRDSVAEVFISYAREDQPFVRRLQTALEDRDLSAWVDWEDIPPTAEWMREVEAAIEGSESLLFVVSPDSVASSTCRREIDHAAAHQKRLVPVVYREVEADLVPEAGAGAQLDLLPRDRRLRHCCRHDCHRSANRSRLGAPAHAAARPGLGVGREQPRPQLLAARPRPGRRRTLAQRGCATRHTEGDRVSRSSTWRPAGGARRAATGFGSARSASASSSRWLWRSWRFSSGTKRAIRPRSRELASSWRARPPRSRTTPSSACGSRSRPSEPRARSKPTGTCARGSSSHAWRRRSRCRARRSTRGTTCSR